MTSALDPLRSAVLELFCELEGVALSSEEATDTDVRDAVHMTLAYYFVWGETVEPFPSSFGMRTAEGDARIGGALLRFIQSTKETARAMALGQARLDLLQDLTLATPTGMRYDEFMGHRDLPLPREPLPSYMFAKGQYE